MNCIKYFIAVAAMLLSVNYNAAGQDVKQESKPGGAGQAVTSEATPTPEGKQQTAEEKPGQAAGKEKRVVAVVDADGVQRVTITGGEYYFDPNYIIVKVNIPVEFVVKKAPGQIPHDIMVKASEAGINFKVSLTKEAQTIKFTPTKIGKYEMYCDKKLLFFKSHKDRGMDGAIEVVQ